MFTDTPFKFFQLLYVIEYSMPYYNIQQFCTTIHFVMEGNAAVCRVPLTDSVRLVSCRKWCLLERGALLEVLQYKYMLRSVSVLHFDSISEIQGVSAASSFVFNRVERLWSVSEIEVVVVVVVSTHHWHVVVDLKGISGRSFLTKEVSQVATFWQRQAPPTNGILRRWCSG